MLHIENTNPVQCKILAFEYTVKCLIDWYNESKHEKEAMQFFSKLKIFKLHFFVSAVNAKKGNETDLLSTFNNFYALPYGHVESDIYSKLGNTQFYTIERDSISIKNSVINFDALDPNTRVLIDSSISSLKKINPNIISYSAFDLVEISHRWYSWKSTFERAKTNNHFGEKINPEIIRIEPKKFFLN